MEMHLINHTPKCATELMFLSGHHGLCAPPSVRWGKGIGICIAPSPSQETGEARHGEGAAAFPVGRITIADCPSVSTTCLAEVARNLFLFPEVFSMEQKDSMQKRFFNALSIRYLFFIRGRQINAKKISMRKRFFNLNRPYRNLFHPESPKFSRNSLEFARNHMEIWEFD